MIFFKNEHSTLVKIIDDVRGQRKTIGYDIGGMKRKKRTNKRNKKIYKRWPRRS